MNIEKLKQEIENKKSNQSNLVNFDLVVAFLGVDASLYYPKLRNENGENLKDEKGKDLRSSNASGFMYTFNEVGTSKIVKVVLDKSYKLDLLGVYSVTGQGYDIRQSSLIFISDDAQLSDYESDE